MAVPSLPSSLLNLLVIIISLVIILYLIFRALLSQCSPQTGQICKRQWWQRLHQVSLQGHDAGARHAHRPAPHRGAPGRARDQHRGEHRRGRPGGGSPRGGLRLQVCVQWEEAQR